MDKLEAFKLVTHVCKMYKGTAKEHEMIGTALNTIGETMFKPNPEVKEVPEQDDNQKG